MTDNPLLKELAETARPLINKTLHRIGADFGTMSYLNKTREPQVKHIEKYHPEIGYGNLMVRFAGENEFLSIVSESARAYMGGSPISWLTLSNQSLPRIHANKYDRFGSSGRIESRYYVLGLNWLELIHGEVLTEVWAACGENVGLYEPTPCVCGIAFKFVRNTELHGERTTKFIGPWYLGVCFDPDDEQAEHDKTILAKYLPTMRNSSWVEIINAKHVV